MTTGFTPIPLREYVELHLHTHPEVDRTELIHQLESAIAAYRAGARCQCGAPIWIVGSAHTGLGCFACITGQSESDQDCEIDVADEEAAG